MQLNHLANGYRLPTEAEWEYCARANVDTMYAGSNNIDDVAWYGTNSEYQTHPVAQKVPNAFGVYDMTGNINEWTSDGKRNYRFAVVDPTCDGPDQKMRVLRGGSWGSNPFGAYVCERSLHFVSQRTLHSGIRLARNVDP